MPALFWASHANVSTCFCVATRSASLVVPFQKLHGARAVCALLSVVVRGGWGLQYLADLGADKFTDGAHLSRAFFISRSGPMRGKPMVHVLSAMVVAAAARRVPMLRKRMHLQFRIPLAGSAAHTASATDARAAFLIGRRVDCVRKRVAPRRAKQRSRVDRSRAADRHELRRQCQTWRSKRMQHITIKPRCTEGDSAQAMLAGERGVVSRQTGAPLRARARTRGARFGAIANFRSSC